jgi:hypothetical protein
MRRAGSIYVSLVLAALAGYFTYQAWFNPNRAVKRQLGELAATLSVPPDGESGMDRLARAARLRNYIAPDVRISTGGSGPEIRSQDAVIAAVAAWNPPAGGWTVSFVDVQIAVDSDTSARAYMTVQVNVANPPAGQPPIEAREVRVEMTKMEGLWLLTAAEPAETLQRP